MGQPSETSPHCRPRNAFLNKEPMQTARESTFDEFAQHFIKRLWRYQCRNLAMPENASARLALMQGWPGKCCEWFHNGRWAIVELNADDLDGLYHVSHDPLKVDRIWRPPAPRTLRNACQFAQEVDYFRVQSPGRESHIDYYQRLKEGSLVLRGSERLAIRTLTTKDCAELKAGDLYIHDGFGRALPYLALVTEGHFARTDLTEAFLWTPE